MGYASFQEMDVRKLIFFLLFLSSSLSAQDNPLNRRISIHLQNVSLQDALKEISIKGRLLYSYNTGAIDLNKKVSITASGKTVEYCLQNILGKDFKLRSGGNHVIIVPQKIPLNKESAESYVLEGVVTDAITGKAVKYASVYEAGRLKSALTDQNGKYAINLGREPEYVQLLVSRKSYRDTVITIRPKKSAQVNVRIRPATIEELAILPAEIPDQLASNGLFKAVISDDQLRVTENLALFEEKVFQIGFLPTLGTNRKFGGLIENHFSFNVLGGYSMALSGAEMAGIFNITRRNVKGFQLAGFMNITGGSTSGFQFAGFMNNNIGAVRGVQTAGFYNLSLDSLNGVQTAGFFNMARGRVKGIQTAGFANISGKELDGVQLAGFLNVSGREVDGVQVSGFANVASGDFRGAQIGGFFNISTGDMKGAQISGGINIVADSSQTIQIGTIANFAGTIKGSQISSLFNIAGEVGGSQIGLINICDTVSGFTFGLISLVRKGYHKLEFSTGDANQLLVNFRTGTYRLYNILSAGMFKVTDPSFATFGYGIGTEFRARKKFFFGLDVVASTVFNEAFQINVIPDLWGKSNFYIGWHPWKGVQLFAGPTFHAYRIDQKNLQGLRPGIEQGDLFFYNEPIAQYFGWMGWQAGIRLF